MFSKKHILYLIIIAIIFPACISYNMRSAALMDAYQKKNFTLAEEVLSSKKWEKQKRNILLYYLNKGIVLHMLGKYNESNKYFHDADYYIEYYQRNYGTKALSYLSNPTVVPYTGENYEKILLHYYATLNYLRLNDLEEALVECKRMMLTMENISTYFKKDSKLSVDAFTHVLLGLIYDAKKDYNNAFIAYRNAYETYKNEFEPILGTSAPLQLKKDLLRTAYLNGFSSDLRLYEKEFNMEFNKNEADGSSLVCFWNNGLCPIKEQNSITFLITNLGNGYVVFTNLELGLSFPFYIGNDPDKVDGLVKMKFLRVSFPKFVSRPLAYTQSHINSENASATLELAEDIDAIAQRTLKDRMAKELGSMLLRLALKKLAEAKVNQTNQGLGTILNITNTITEQADTRSWQLLPSAINYTRLPLNSGKNNISISLGGNDQFQRKIDTLTINVGNYPKTYFHSYTTIGD